MFWKGIVHFFKKIFSGYIFALFFISATCVYAKNQAFTYRVGIQSANISRFVLETSDKFTYTIDYLNNPNRIAINIDNLDTSSVKKESEKAGFIKSISMDTNGKGVKVFLNLSTTAKVKKHFILSPISDNKNYRLVIDLENTTNEEFLSFIKKEEQKNNTSKKKENVILEEEILSETPQKTEVKKENKIIISTTKKLNIQNEPKTKTEKIIVIDAGHGGKDPGTIGVNGTYEKTIALAFARQLRDILTKNPNYKVVLTRDSDIFIQLQDRAKIAEKANASLFISIHLNSSPNKQTKGFSIYTLSEKATDEESKKIAEKENAADLLGIGSFDGYDKITKNILGDLLQTQVKIASVEFADEIVKQVKQDTPCIYHPHREAPFIVLRSSIPSVLIEAGFLSNKEDEKKLNQKWYREKMAYSFARAIDIILQK